MWLAVSGGGGGSTLQSEVYLAGNIYCVRRKFSNHASRRRPSVRDLRVVRKLRIWRQPKRARQQKAHCSVLSGKNMCTLGSMEWLFFVCFCFFLSCVWSLMMILWDGLTTGWNLHVASTSLSLFLSLSLSSYSIFFCLFSVVVLLTSMSVSFSVRIDRSCIRLLSPLFSLLCSVLVLG